MKQINIHFEDREFEQLLNVKGNLSWHDLILKLVEPVEVKAK